MVKKINYSNLFGLLVGIGFLSISIILSLKTYQNGSQNITIEILSMLIFSFVGYLFISTAICRLQYDSLQNKRNVQIDIQNKEIAINNLEKINSQIVLNVDNVTDVEIYFSWNTNPFSSDLGYSKIFLKDNSIQLITQNEIHQSLIKKVFGKKVVEKKSKFKHYLN